MGDVVAVRDDGTPAGALGAASEFVRAANVRSLGRFGGRPGWRFPSDAYDCVGAAVELATRLQQVLEQAMFAVRDQNDLHRVGAAQGFAHEGDPDGAIEALSVALDGARVAAQRMCSGLGEAHVMLAGLSYTGPDVPESE